LGTISSKTDDVIMIFDSANSALKKISIRLNYDKFDNRRSSRRF